MSNRRAVPMVLVVVSGGNAYCEVNGEVDVEIFDGDNYRADPIGTKKLSARFSDLGLKLGVEASAICATDSLSEGSGCK